MVTNHKHQIGHYSPGPNKLYNRHGRFITPARPSKPEPTWGKLHPRHKREVKG